MLGRRLKVRGVLLVGRNDVVGVHGPLNSSICIDAGCREAGLIAGGTSVLLVLEMERLCL